MSFRSYDLLHLVRDFGESLTLSKVTSGGTYNPATGEVDGSATTDYTFTGYFYNYDTGISGNMDMVVRGVRKCVIPALNLAVEPETNDLVTGNNDDVKIISVVTIFSNGTPVCYLCDVRE
jgi:hypothetical protein